MKKWLMGKEIKSLGVHLIGERSQGLGYYGFSSHYLSSKLAEQRAVDFINRIKDTFETNVWLENANFYSPDTKSLINSLQSISDICRKTSSLLIVDLSHLSIDATNCKLPPALLAGKIDWELVVEIHLSGLAKGSDGTLHDSHSLTVPPILWDLVSELNTLWKLSPLQTKYLTVEHSDQDWITRKDEWLSDISRALREIDRINQNSEDKSSVHKRAQEYAEAYQVKILKKRIPGIESALTEEKINIETLHQDWLNSLKQRDVLRIALTHEDILPSENSRVIQLEVDFLEFIQRRFNP
ncbi:MAG: DUF692 family protein [Bdellovibrionales bacterium]|nr:DUF692 family protein [Bdellovibrionales bacterium]